MKKRIISALLCSALALTTLAACGSSSDNSESTTQATGKTDSGSVEKVTVHFANFFVEGQDYHDLTEEAVKKFNEENDQT